MEGTAPLRELEKMGEECKKSCFGQGDLTIVYIKDIYVSDHVAHPSLLTSYPSLLVFLSFTDIASGLVTFKLER